MEGVRLVTEVLLAERGRMPREGVNSLVPREGVRSCLNSLVTEGKQSLDK